MNQIDFDALVSLVLESNARPPKTLFTGGYEDWHARARLGHFLCMPDYARMREGTELLASVGEAEVNEENPEDVEEKVFALQKLSACLRENKDTLDPALNAINQAIELAESTDYLYKYILRGELWADRWITLHLLKKTDIALAEAEEKIEAYEAIPVPHNSYLYYAFRLKAQIAGENATTLIAKDFMHKALSYMDVHEEYREGLEIAFAANHDNIAWILSEIDRATPPPDKLHWDI